MVPSSRTLSQAGLDVIGFDKFAQRVDILGDRRRQPAWLRRRPQCRPGPHCFQTPRTRTPAPARSHRGWSCQSACRACRCHSFHGMFQVIRGSGNEIVTPSTSSNTRANAPSTTVCTSLAPQRTFQVQLRKFRLAVGPAVLVPKQRKLEVPVHTGHHQQLLVYLRALGQRIAGTGCRRLAPKSAPSGVERVKIGVSTP